MKIKTEVKDGITIINPEGEMTLNNVNELDDLVKSKISEGALKIVLNFKSVSYLDSSAVGTIVASYSNLQAAGGALRLCELSDDVMEIFKATSLDSFLTIDQYEKESVHSFF